MDGHLETLAFFNKRTMNDLIDGRVSYYDKEENIEMISKKKGKLKKNVFTQKKKKVLSLKCLKINILMNLRKMGIFMVP
jgi:hypothetical protein